MDNNHPNIAATEVLKHGSQHAVPGSRIIVVVYTPTNEEAELQLSLASNLDSTNVVRALTQALDMFREHISDEPQGNENG